MPSAHTGKQIAKVPACDQTRTTIEFHEARTVAGVGGDSTRTGTLPTIDSVQISDDIEHQFLGEDEVIGQNSSMRRKL